MSFVDRIKLDQRMIVAVLGGLATGYVLFRAIKGSSSQETAQKKRKREIQALRKTINVQDPSYDDIKRIIQFSLHETKLKLNEFSKTFKQKRLRFNKHTRVQNFKQYVNLLSDGIQQMQVLALRQTQQLMAQLGIDRSRLQKFDSVIQRVFGETMQIQGQNISQITPMKLQQAKFAFRQQINFAKQHGLQYSRLMVQAIKDWPQNKLANLPMILNEIIYDGAFQGYPQITTDAFQHAEQTFKNELMSQIQELQLAVLPMLVLLSESLDKKGNMFKFGQPQGGAHSGFGHQAPHSPLFYR